MLGKSKKLVFYLIDVTQSASCEMHVVSILTCKQKVFCTADTDLFLHDIAIVLPSAFKDLENKVKKWDLITCNGVSRFVNSIVTDKIKAVNNFKKF